MKHKKIIIIIDILLGVFAIALWGGITARRMIIEKVCEKITAKLAPFEGVATAELAPVYSHPMCIEVFKVIMKGGTEVRFYDLCLDKLPMTLDMPVKTDLTASRVEGRINPATWESIREKGNAEKIGGGSFDDTYREYSLKAEKVYLLLGQKGQQVTWNGGESIAELKNGHLHAHSAAIPGIDIDKAPVAFRNIPELDLTIDAELKEKSAHAILQANPGIELAFSRHDKLIEAQVGAVEATLNRDGLELTLERSGFNMPEFKTVSNVYIERVTTSFSTPIPQKDSLKSLSIESPELKIDLSELIASAESANNPVISGLVGFWRQDAGAFLGEAPKKSVRREDVKKNKPAVRKNPIPKKTLEAIHHSFDELQKKIMSMPAVGIRNGRIQILNQGASYEFDAISFNTAELFKDTQKFEIEFNVREASADFLVAYDKDSPFPKVAFKVQKLNSADFLHILNMPVPEKNAGEVSLNLALSMSDEDFKISGDIDFSEFAFFHEKVSPNLVEHVNASAKIEAVYSFASDSLSVKPMTLRSGPITANGFVTISNVRSDPLIEFELWAEDIPCEDIPKAIPKGFLPTITDLRIIGTTMSPKISGKIPWKYPLTATLRESGFEDRCFPVSVAPHEVENLNHPEYTFTTDYTYFEDSITVGPGTKHYVPLEEIPPYVKAAMFLTEDKRFFDHGPLRMAFIERALRLNLNQRRYVYGGSTIAQQLTKNLFLTRTKNLARKLEEALIAWRMECVVPRLRIFELYLNVIEFGPDIYGIYKGAKFYFDKEPKDLTPLEGAFLASLKVSPSKGGRFYKFGFEQNGRWWHKRMRYIMKVLAENGYISVAEAVAAYNWTPKFVYPTRDNDYRQIWLNRYGKYLLDKMKEKKKEEKEEAEAEER